MARTMAARAMTMAGQWGGLTPRCRGASVASRPPSTRGPGCSSRRGPRRTVGTVTTRARALANAWRHTSSTARPTVAAPCSWPGRWHERGRGWPCEWVGLAGSPRAGPPRPPVPAGSPPSPTAAATAPGGTGGTSGRPRSPRGRGGTGARPTAIDCPHRSIALAYGVVDPAQGPGGVAAGGERTSGPSSCHRHDGIAGPLAAVGTGAAGVGVVGGSPCASDRQTKLGGGERACHPSMVAPPLGDEARARPPPPRVTAHGRARPRW
jgi:hypothetical protein